MPNKPFSLELWQQQSDYVLAVLLGEPLVEKSEFHYWLGLEEGLSASDFPPGKWRETFDAISALTLERQPVHLTTLQARMSADYTQYHAQLYAVYGQSGQSTLRDDVFAANVHEVKRLALIDRDIRLLNSSAEKLRSGEERNTVVGNAVSGLVMTSAGQLQGETAAASARDFRSHMDSHAEKDFKCGIAILDDWIEGFSQSNLIILASAMKQRKTSLLLNKMLHMARHQGMSVALMMFESTRQMVVAQIVAMLAIEWLIEHGLYDEPVREGSPILHRFISPDALVKLRERYRGWKDHRVEAVDYGIEQWSQIGKQFRIYDRTEAGGGLSDSGSIARIALRDKTLYGTDFVGIDHAQRIDAPGTEYEKLTHLAPFIEKLARREQLAVELLAQLKQDNANRQGQGEEEGYTSGIRGGSVLDEAGDYLLKTAYRLKLRTGFKLPDNKLMVQLKHSRYGVGGENMKAVIDIDPYTGLVLNGGRGEFLSAHEAF